MVPTGVLVETGVENCGIFISANEMDEINIIASCRKKIGAEYFVARVRKITVLHFNSLVRSLGRFSLLI